MRDDVKNTVKMRQIMEKVFQAGQKDLSQIVETEKEDPFKDREEGIFIFTRKQRCCQFQVPVDEE